MIIEFHSSGIGMFMMVLKELWDSFVKSHKVFVDIAVIYSFMTLCRHELAAFLRT